jgi:RNA polymerase sigma factor (sigma-70 family)
MSASVPESRSSLHAARERQELECFGQMRTGDEAAFETLFRAYAKPLCAFAYTYVGSTAAAQEIVQELFCRIWERRDTLEMPRSVHAYLFSATRNRAIAGAAKQFVRRRRPTSSPGRFHPYALSLSAVDASMLDATARRTSRLLSHLR